ncbi:MAG TPA: hypothetical protein VE800_01130 [Actinomycetota bacterium]|nr:hypothetical protein [Actinomycetota bacterium]
MSRPAASPTEDDRSAAASGRATAFWRGWTLGGWLAVVAGAAFVAISLPVVLNGAPLADDYWLCLRPARDGSFWPYFGAMWQDGGVVRPARYLEYALISRCTDVPFAFVIVVPLALKLIVAWLLCRLLRDLGLASPWPGVAAAVWMLEPLGTESALWPAALHIGLGLTLALSALLGFRHDRVALGTLAALGAFLSLEQAIFALPLAVWWTGSKTSRRRATIATAVAACVVLAAYATWPGVNPKNTMAVADRLHGLIADPSWYVLFPAAGLGFHSGSLGFVWMLPFSLAVVLGAAALGSIAAPAILRGSRGSPIRWSFDVVAIPVALIFLINLPLLLTLPNVGLSARTFTPTWLVVSALVARVGASVRWQRVRLLGAVAGTLAAFAVMSLLLSVSVRLRTAEFDRAAAGWIAARTVDGDVVAVCDVPRTVVEPAPVGSFHLHALHSEESSWVQYHTGRIVEVRRSGERYWGAPCPLLDGADLIVSFPDLLRDVTSLRVHRGTP